MSFFLTVQKNPNITQYFGNLKNFKQGYCKFCFISGEKRRLFLIFPDFLITHFPMSAWLAGEKPKDFFEKLYKLGGNISGFFLKQLPVHVVFCDAKCFGDVGEVETSV